MFEFKNAVEVSITPKIFKKVKCISKPNSKSKITIGKKYIINMISILNRDYRITTDSGRNVWYGKKYFQLCK